MLLEAIKLKAPCAKFYVPMRSERLMYVRQVRFSRHAFHCIFSYTRSKSVGIIYVFDLIS